MSAGLPDKLRAVVGGDHVATGVDLSAFVVEGRTPEAAVFPGSVEEVAAVVRLAADTGVPVVPWGGGTAAALGTPATRAAIVLALRRLNRLVEHEPGDLTATAQAGMVLGELQAALGARGQWLSLDPPDPERATVGGVLAANASGPRRHLYGTARDLLIGVTVVTGEGTVVRGGGKVVKNVAGYDLPKLFVGSHGTLGILVEATLKLRPRPEAEALVGLGFERLKDAGAAARGLAAGDLIPTAVELLDAPAAAVVLAGAGGEGPRAVAGALLVVGFDGLPEQVEWQVEELGKLGASFGARGVLRLPDATWARLTTAAREAGPAPAAVMRLALLPSLVAETMEHGAGAARHRGFASAWTAHAGVGVATAALFTEESRHDPGAVAAVLGEWRAMARGAGGHATLAWAPLSVKSLIAPWDDPGAAGRIMQRIKAQVDPHDILNPGRFVAGI